jgi:hypothetical protein
MTMTPCRWCRLVRGIACTRGGPNRGCRPITLNSCTFPGFERVPLEAGACLDCEYFNADALPRRRRPLPPRKAVVMDWPRPRGWRGPGTPTAHLACADLDCLHRFAAIVGLKREWFQGGRRPHYDVIGADMIGRAMRAGAVRVNAFDLVRVILAARETG